jgi:plastocyanin
LGLALLPFVAATIHDIKVGAGGLTFSPEAISAQSGDQVVFHFVAKNHTATQSSFPSPCGAKEGGFDSGFMPVAANQTDNFPTYTITINNTDPVWFFCKQAAASPASHCGQGMVFAVNCGLDGAPNSFTNFKQSAMAIGASLVESAANAPTTAAYGDYTIPGDPTATLVTQTVTLQSSTWTTTYSSYPGSAAPTPAALEGTVHKVIVGGPNLAFDPPTVNAAPRDTIQFEFHQKNHTVTQSSFADPCRKLSVNGTAAGFDSGFQAVSDNSTVFPTWSFVVNDTTPIWAYCRQLLPKSHCGAGMVFAVNSVDNSPRNFTAFQQVAEALNGTSAPSTGSNTTGPNNPTDSGVVTSVSFSGPVLSLLIAAVIASVL